MKSILSFTASLGTVLILIFLLYSPLPVSRNLVLPEIKRDVNSEEKGLFSLASPIFAQGEGALCQNQPQGYQQIREECVYCYGQKLGENWGYRTQLVYFCRLFSISPSQALIVTPTPIPWPTPVLEKSF